MAKHIITYRNVNGNEPFSQWLNKFRKKNLVAATRIARRMLYIEENNHYGDYKYLRDGIYELRYHFGAGYRVYFAEDGDTIVILLCAGDKNTQERDIEKAVAYWQDYQIRNKQEGK